MIRYCGRNFTPEELDLIINLIKNNPKFNRTRLSKEVCRMLQWLKPDGKFKDMSCRVAMLRMHKNGIIVLPPSTRIKRPVRIIEFTPATEPQSPVLKSVDRLPPLHFRMVNKTNSALWNEYIERYHYLGYTPLPGAQLRYFIYAGEQIVALTGFGAAAWQTAPRDQFIGWSHEQRKKNLHLVTNNARFLILPWIKSKNLASKILSMTARNLPDDWEERYNIRPVLLESFVEKKRFTGTCYKAANWQLCGQTKGRGKLGPAGEISVPIKDVWVYPLDNKFKNILKN
ncbi:MAG: DUF4338 domain-containing protein [Deltaproteobacteria bacterium]|nr:DUF4338 domain-containing protein [Deltaproteobacteria bacterium]